MEDHPIKRGLVCSFALLWIRHKTYISDALQKIILKKSDTRFLASGFCHKSVFPLSLTNLLKPFKTFTKIRPDILK